MARSIDTPARRIFLTIGAEGAVLCVVTPTGEIKESHWSFGRDPEQLAELADWLKARPKRPIHLLVDLAEIKIRIETVPKSSGFDRRRLLARRLDALYANAPTAAAMPLVSAPAGFESELAEGRLPFLLAALPESTDWLIWASWLAALPNRIISVRLLPVELASMVQRLAHALELDGDTAPPWTLYLAPHRSGGMRQIVVTPAGFAMTRLTPLSDPEGTLQDVASDVRDEIAATITYLSRLGYEPVDGLDVIVCADPALEPVLTDLPIGRGRLRLIEAGRAGKLLRLKGTAFENDDDADLLATAWAASRPRAALILPTENLIPERAESRRINRLRRMAWVGATLLGVAALLLTSVIGIERANRDRTAGEVETARTRVEELRQQRDRAAPNGLDEMLALKRHFDMPQPDHAAILADLTASLPTDLRLARLDWRSASKADGGWRIEAVLDLSAHATRLEARDRVLDVMARWEKTREGLVVEQLDGPLMATPDQRFSGQIGGQSRNSWVGEARRATLAIRPAAQELAR